MNELPGHSLPKYSDEDRDDALFHYTTATGLIGIFLSKEIWSTAYYCTNDHLELLAGRGVLKREFMRATFKMIDDKDPVVKILAARGVNVMSYPENFENQLVVFAFSDLCPYITCFCKPIDKEDFEHGLLSQWRAYGPDGGYAIQFSRKKLLRYIEDVNRINGLNYNLQDVHYDTNNPLKHEVVDHAEVFLGEYRRFLSELLVNRNFAFNPLPNLLGGPLESFIEYVIHTKSQHFSEERECRLSLVVPVARDSTPIPVNYFNRSGLIIPYVATPDNAFRLVDCIEWIIIGPNPRMAARFRSVRQMIRTTGLEIQVRPSHIPFIRA